MYRGYQHFLLRQSALLNPRNIVGHAFQDDNHCPCLCLYKSRSVPSTTACRCWQQCLALHAMRTSFPPMLSRETLKYASNHSSRCNLVKCTNSTARMLHLHGDKVWKTFFAEKQQPTFSKSRVHLAYWAHWISFPRPKNKLWGRSGNLSERQWPPLNSLQEPQAERLFFFFSSALFSS